jgi:hypothetical protein
MRYCAVPLLAGSSLTLAKFPDVDPLNIRQVSRLALIVAGKIPVNCTV